MEWVFSSQAALFLEFSSHKDYLVIHVHAIYSLNSRRKLHLDSIRSMDATQTHLCSFTDSSLFHTSYPAVARLFFASDHSVISKPWFSVWRTRRLGTRSHHYHCVHNHFLEQNCFTVWCSFLLYKETKQPYAHMYTLPLRPPSHSLPSHMVTTLEMQDWSLSPDTKLHYKQFYVWYTLKNESVLLLFSCLIYFKKNTGSLLEKEDAPWWCLPWELQTRHHQPAKHMQGCSNVKEKLCWSVNRTNHRC